MTHKSHHDIHQDIRLHEQIKLINAYRASIYICIDIRMLRGRDADMQRPRYIGIQA